MRKKEKKRYPGWYNVVVVLLLLDLTAMNLAWLFALMARFDFSLYKIPYRYFIPWANTAVIHSLVNIAIYHFMGLYKSIWHYVGIDEMRRTFAASLITSGIHIVFITVRYWRMPLTYYVLGWIFEFFLITGIRYSYRTIRKIKRILEQNRKSLDNVMVIGAGEAGRMLIKEMVNSEHLTTKVCCIIDDDVNKQGRMLGGVKVVGNRNDIMKAVSDYEIKKIIFAIPTAALADKRDILNICNETGCEVMVLPGIYQMINGEVSVSRLHSVSVEELLGRESVKVNMEEILGYVSGRTIMVTGGGGSIGSELCRQIAAHTPGKLIIFELYENNAYDIQQELLMKYPDLNLTVLIGSVRDTRRMESVFKKYRPDIVYHAAAHKHVPLMEESPNEAVKNNVFGTYKTAMAASKYGTKKFVLISTDKAVNPTSVMGATKRICEMIIQDFDRTSETEFVAVRFGNVLGSNGSVIPLFKKQIQSGGPVTVTHPDIIRYFMTIPEAVSLVLQAGAYAQGGEIFILDMGEPVKIDTLARNLIRMSGYTPDVDIEIKYTGLRPGEKMYEELLISEEGIEKTKNDLIYIGKPIQMDSELFMEDLARLKGLAENNTDDTKRILMQMVSRYGYREKVV